jgi:hypothetical protein
MMRPRAVFRRYDRSGLIALAALVIWPVLAIADPSNDTVPTSALETRPAQLRLTYEQVDSVSPKPWGWAS